MTAVAGLAHRLSRLFVAVLLPPFGYWRRLRRTAVIWLSLLWLSAWALTLMLWAGPGLLTLIALSIHAGASEIEAWRSNSI